MEESNNLVYYQDCLLPKVVRKWPLPRVVRPGASFLIQSTLPQLPVLQPLDPKIHEDLEANKEKLGKASKIIADMDAKSKSLCEELESMEKVSRWHDRGNREPRIKQINLQLAEIKTKKEAAKNSYNTLMKEAESSLEIVSLHESLVKSYEKLEKLK
jgi:hypothetical protein